MGYDWLDHSIRIAFTHDIPGGMMKLTIKDLEQGQPIPARYAFGIPDAKNHMAFGENLSPEMSWSDVPEGTKSFVILVKDVDVPSVADDVNQEGKSIPVGLPRVDFYHWVLIDIPADITRIGEGEDSRGVTVGGKKPGRASIGIRGVNNYTQFFAGNPDLEGIYGGYDGPCPPWNDERLHHYHFTVYALDVASLALDGEFQGPDVVKAMEGHILAEATVTGTYTLNPQVKS